MERIYFDYNATTPVDPQVAGAVSSCLASVYGNPSSIHAEGRTSHVFIDEARENVAGLLNCDPSEIIFTGCGSESNNTAIKGVAGKYEKKGRHIVTSRVEHPSILRTLDYLAEKGWKITYLDVDAKGNIDLEGLSASIGSETVLVSLMMANNETGCLFPIKKAAAIAHEKGVIFHTDAVQAVGKIHVDVNDLGVDLLSLAAHKFYGPKGVGALYAKKTIELAPLIHGGGQEFGKRGGTENLGGISGMSAAAVLVRKNLNEEMNKIKGLTDYLKCELKDKIKNIVFLPDHENKLSNTLCIGFRGLSGESLLMALDLEGIAVSAGSACSSGALSPSHVLTAMGIDDTLVNSAIRISLGRWSSRDEIDAFLKILTKIVDQLKKD